jgi:plastocyanin
MGGIFFVFGGVLVAAALILAFVGIRGHESFPANRPLLIVGTAVFAAVVVGTTAFAVVNAREEQDHREAELAEEEAVAEAEAGEGAQAPPTPAGQPGAAAGGSQQAPAPPQEPISLSVTSPADGSTTFEPGGLQAEAGAVTIAYENPSPVPHNIAVEAADGSLLGETETFANGEQELVLEDLAPGEYIYFCTVPGHREGGMEGDLTVGG